MKSLTACMKKAGKAISSADAAFLQSVRKDYLDEGLKASEAVDRAINDYIDELNQEVSSLEAEIEEAGGQIDRAVYSLKDKLPARLQRAIDQGYVVDFHKMVEDLTDGKIKAEELGQIYNSEREKYADGLASGRIRQVDIRGNVGVSKNKREPFTFFHGTSDNVEYFVPNHPNQNDSGWLGSGIYLTNDLALGAAYAEHKENIKRGDAEPNVMALHAKFSKPFLATVDHKELLKGKGRKYSDAFTKKLQSQGYDSVIMPHKKKGVFEVVVFSHTNVRSVDAEFSNDKQDSIQLLYRTDKSEKDTMRIFETEDGVKWFELPDGTITDWFLDWKTGDSFPLGMEASPIEYDDYNSFKHYNEDFGISEVNDDLLNLKARKALAKDPVEENRIVNELNDLLDKDEALFNKFLAETGFDAQSSGVQEADYQFDLWLKNKAMKPRLGVVGKDSDILYRTSDGTETFTPPEQDGWLNKAIRYIQDKHLPLKLVQNAILDNGKSIKDSMNAYVKEELMHEKAALDLENVQDAFIQPIIDKLTESGITQSELDLFLYAKHAPERNKMIAERHKELTDGGSGMTDQEAADILNEYKIEGKTKDLEQIADLVYKMLEDKNNRLKDAGTLTDAQQQSWSKIFKHYVPLKGFQVDKGDIETLIIGRTGKGFNIKGNESMKAMGRRSMSASPLTVAIQDSTSAILRARKNEVGQAFLALVKDNPNPKYWGIYDKGNLPTKMRLNSSTNTVEETKLGIFEMTPENGFMGVKVKGEQKFIRIEDKRLLMAMNNLGPEPITGVIKMMASATRVLSSLNTSLNPEFMISNMARDIQTAIFNALGETDMKRGKLLTVKDKKAFVARMANPKTIMAAMRGINRGIKNHKDGGEWAKHWHDFREQGAKTGYFDMKDFNALSKDLENMMEMSKGGFKGNARKIVKNAGEFIDRMNTSVENAVRLSAYVNGVESGLTKQEAASLAKNLTVNFNRKGEITWLNAIYMFGNASVQGTAQFVRSVGANPFNHPSGKNKLNLAQKAAVAMSASGYLFSMLGRELGGEADDGEKWIDKVPDHVLERNLVIMKSIFGGEEDGTYWTIPLPYGYNIFHNIGTSIENMGNGSKRKSVAWASRFLTFSALGSFSPIGLNSSEKGLETALLKTATPTLFKPFTEMALNENFFGGSIYRNDTFDRHTIPDSIGKPNTGQVWKNTSTFLNEVTGGSDFKGGFIDIAPESFKHLIQGYGGGLLRLAEKSVDLAEKTSSDKEIEDRNIPFFRKISGQVSHYGNQSDFYNRKDEILVATAEFKSLKGKARIEFRRDNADILSLRALSKSTEKRLRALRKRKKVMYSSTRKDKERQLEMISKMQQIAVDRFNRQYNTLFN